MNDLYLRHHGILGMHWGVRRFQPYDAGYQADHIGKFVGSLKKHDVDRSGYKKADVEKVVDRYNNELYRGAPAKKLNKLRSDVRFEREKEASQKQKKISERQAQYEKEYQEKGATKEEAAAYAHQKIAAEKIIAVTAAVGLTALASYGAYKLIRARGDNFGGTIKMGTMLSRISTNDNQGVRDAFYASLSKNAGDVQKYRGMYGNTLASAGRGVYEKSIRAVGDIKVASRKDVAKVLTELRDLPDFRVQMDKMLRDARSSMIPGLNSTEGQYKVVDKAIKAIQSGKIDKNVSDAFNQVLVGGGADDRRTKEAITHFYDALKKKGYGAIVDMNDRKYSGYNTKRPLIIFDTAKVSVDAVRRVGREEISSDNAKAMGRLAAETAGKAFVDGIPGKVMGMTLLGSVAAGTKVSDNKKDAKFVEEYKKEHPKTDLSYREIARMRYDKSK